MKKLFLTIITTICLLTMACIVFADTSVTLEWSANTEPDLAGYRIFVREAGQSYDYTKPAWEGMNTTCTIYRLDETKDYFFVARAFDTEGFDSGDSNEVEYKGKPIEDGLPPDKTALTIKTTTVTTTVIEQ